MKKIDLRFQRKMIFSANYVLTIKAFGNYFKFGFFCTNGTTIFIRKRKK